MNTAEHLERIKAKCREMVSAFPPCESTAGWRSTIAAIDALSRIEQLNFTGWDGDMGARSDASNGLDEIIAAWPEELL